MIHMVKHGDIKSIFCDFRQRLQRRRILAIVSYTIYKGLLHACCYQKFHDYVYEHQVQPHDTLLKKKLKNGCC